MSDRNLAQFIESATRVGAQVSQMADLDEALGYISSRVDGTTLVPRTPLSDRHGLQRRLAKAGVSVFADDFRTAGQFVAGGVTFSNFALADSGTVVLESTAEDIRLATTLPEKHFILVDPATILADNLAAAGPLRDLHRGGKGCFVAYITGPSRTADIERVLTIGCHGPRELHILLVAFISNDLLEN
jgi:L-lactate dehydrogenase complex protein LldG